MDAMLEQYLLKKKAAQEELDSANEGVGTASLFSNLGDVIAGNKIGSGNQYFDDVRKRNQADTIGKVESERNDYVQNMKDNSNLKDLISKEELRTASADPNSRSSILGRAIAKKYNLPVQEGDSMESLSQFMDPRELIKTEANANVDFNKQKALKEMEFGNERAMLGLKQTKEDKKKNDPKEKLKSLSGQDKARYDNALMALKGLDEMGKALDGGDNTFSVVGDNNYTKASRRATEAYGRMQSGGAINKEEEARFDKTLPGKLDSKAIQRQKILEQKNEMISRLKTLGFTPEEAGYSSQDFMYGKEDAAPTRTVVKRQINPGTGETRLVYSDGSTEILSAVAGGK